MNALISSPDRGGSLTAGGVLFGYRQCRHQPDHAFGRKRSSHPTGRRAALEQRGQPCSRTERCEAVEECLREKANADRDRTLEWSRFGPCAGPKSSKAMPPHQVEENERTHRRVASAASCLDFLRRDGNSNQGSGSCGLRFRETGFRLQYDRASRNLSNFGAAFSSSPFRMTR